MKFWPLLIHSCNCIISVRAYLNTEQISQTHSLWCRCSCQLKTLPPAPDSAPSFHKLVLCLVPPNLLEEGTVLECGTIGGECTNEEVLSGVGEDPALIPLIPGEVVLRGNAGGLVFLSALAVLSTGIEVYLSSDLDEPPHAPLSLSILLFGVLLIQQEPPYELQAGVLWMFRSVGFHPITDILIPADFSLSGSDSSRWISERSSEIITSTAPVAIILA